MKKSSLILLSIISIFLLSGCGKIDKALNNMKDLKSYTMKMESTSNGNTSSTVLEFDYNNKVIKETSVSKLGNKDIEDITYTQILDNSVVSYSKGVFGDNWIYDEVSSEYRKVFKEASENIFVDEVNKVLSFDTSLFKKVKSDIKGMYKYQIDLDELSDFIDFEYSVYTDGKYITRINISSGNVSEILTFSNFNSTTVVIPDDVKENAKKIGEIDFSNIDLSQYSDIDVSDIDNDAIKEQIEKAKEYMNSDEFKDQMQKAQDYMNSDEFKNQMQKAQDYMNSDEFKDQMQKAQDYMNSEEYQRQMQEAQERARAFLNR